MIEYFIENGYVLWSWEGFVVWNGYQLLWISIIILWDFMDLVREGGGC